MPSEPVWLQPDSLECACNDYILCPYCGWKFHPDDGCYYDGDLTGMDCDDCGKTFTVRVNHSVTWSTEKREETPNAE